MSGRLQRWIDPAIFLSLFAGYLTALLASVRNLVYARDEGFYFHAARSYGKWFQLHDARCEPKPVQAELPIWVGGGGEKRTLRIVAKYADGWNIPFVAPETFAARTKSRFLSESA